MELTYCDDCESITNVMWNPNTELMEPPYVDGGRYCECPADAID